MVRVSKKNMIIGVIIVGLLMVSGVPALLWTIGEPIDVKGVTYYSHGIAGNSVEAGAPEDLLDAGAYITSWTDGTSEKIVIQGHWKFYDGGPLGCVIHETWYVVKLEGQGDTVLINGVRTNTWTSERVEVADSAVGKEQWIPLADKIITLTNPFEGRITVELWAYHSWDLYFVNSGDDKIAEDFAELRTGIGSITAPDDVIEEGEYAKFTVKTGYSTSLKTDGSYDSGWTVNVYCLRTGSNVFTKTLGDDVQTVISWLVPDGAFVTVGDNTYRAVLRNELWDKDFDDLFVIGAGMSDMIPELPTYELVSGDYPFEPGESITVQMHAESNEDTDSPITGFWVNVFYETATGSATTQFIYDHRWFEATPTATGGTAVVSFVFPEAGYVRLTASAQDANNLNSGNSEMRWTVYDDDGGDDDGDDSEDIDWNSIIIVLILIAGAFVVYTQAPFPPFYKLLIAMALVIIAAYFAMQAFGV